MKTRISHLTLLILGAAACFVMLLTACPLGAVSGPNTPVLTAQAAAGEPNTPAETAVDSLPLPSMVSILTKAR